MMFSPDGIFYLARLLVGVSVFLGPPNNSGQPRIPRQAKVHALVRFARSGETRECEKVLTTIRTYKAEAEATLPKYVQANNQLRDAIRNNKALMKGAGTAAQRASVQRALDGHKETLRIFEWQEANWRKLIESRRKEERAFVQFFLMIDKIRRGMKAR